VADATLIASIGIFGEFVLFGVFVFLRDPGAPGNRWLGLILFAEAFANQGDILATYLPNAPGTAVARLASAAALAYIPGYLAFLGLAVPGALTHPFRTRAGQWMLGIGAAAAAAYGGLVPRPVGPEETLRFLLVLGVFLFGLVAALDLVRRSESGRVARDRARAFAFSFGVRDLGIALALILLAAGVAEDGLLLLFYNATTALYLVALAFAVLRGAIFEVDIHLRQAIRRGVPVSVLLATFLVVTQLVENQLENQLGWLWGSVAAGLALFLLSPLDRLGNRMATAAVPRARRLNDLADSERRALYRDHVRAAWEDGTIDRSDRRLLDQLRSRLGLSEYEAGALEVRYAPR
jgi:hypothetical protein